MRREFDRARRAALAGDLVRLLRQMPTELLPFDQVKETLRLRGLVDRGFKEIPLDRVVGTLGRHRELNRVFLPRNKDLRERWQNVASLAESRGFPPIEVYQVGDAYFVVDGHHRVSVMRHFGAETIEAYVKEFQTRVPLSETDSIESILRKEGLADFLEATGLHPADDDEFMTTVGNGYERLLDHISVHRYFLSIERSAFVEWRDAVSHWYETLYRPVIDRVRNLEDLPKAQTPTDIYLFAMDHLHALRKQYGDGAGGPEEAVEALAEEAQQARLKGTRPPKTRSLRVRHRRTKKLWQRLKSEPGSTGTSEGSES